MNEAQTRLNKVDPEIKKSLWSVEPESKILVEQNITNGKIGSSSKKPLRADFILMFKGVKLAVIEAKRDEVSYSEGVAQAKLYAQMMNIRFAYATNGNEIYSIDMLTGIEGLVNHYPSPSELWEMTYAEIGEWKEKFLLSPFFTKPDKSPRYYQENAVNKALDAIAEKRNRILLTLATGTGKTFIAFQIAWKLYNTKWSLNRDGRRPKILFLADRNILANQAQTDFGGFDESLTCRITPDLLSKNQNIPTGQNIYFSIFQTLVTPKEDPSYKKYPNDFFDLIIIDECHRGGANDDSKWRDILEYFYPAVQLGLTATPRRDVNIDTYNYFGEPVYQYSLKNGIEDGFLTPFRHVEITTSLDSYKFCNEDTVLAGDDELDEERVYEENDFYIGRIEIEQRDKLRVEALINDINTNDKTLVFCYNQAHAAKIRDMINQFSAQKNPMYCVRVTANDGSMGENYLRQFQDNENLIPTILTTSQKLSTGVDARNVRNIVLMRPINSMIEFKQIIGRGTRIFENKKYFTIYDFVKASSKYQDDAWDGEPICARCKQVDCICDDIDVPICSVCNNRPCICGKPICPVCHQRPCVCEKIKEPCPVCGCDPCVCEGKPPVEKIIIKLSDTRVITVDREYMFYGGDGKPVSTSDFIMQIYGILPDYFNSEQELRKMWANPIERKELLHKLELSGFGMDSLLSIQEVLNAKDSDILDILELIAYNIPVINRDIRVENNMDSIYSNLSPSQTEFIDFLVDKYIKEGVSQFNNDDLDVLVKMKYNTLADASNVLGGISEIRTTFTNFQKSLYGVS